MSGLQRTDRSHECPICGKHDWCMVAEDGSVAICPRVSDGAVKDLGEAGFLHILRESPRETKRRQRLVPKRTEEQKPSRYWRGLATRYASQINFSQLKRLADDLGLSVQSLQRLQIGWSGSAWSFPMVDAAGAVCGIRLRTPSGKKFAVTGSRSGLFIPSDLTEGDPLLIAEGPTDTAALLDLGFAAVGRASCHGGIRLVADLVKRLQVRNTVIVADADEMGQRGAASLASVLVLYCRNVRVLTPPNGVKDARAWKQRGATHHDVAQGIANTPKRNVAFRFHKTKRGH